jgi:hypothetical protein
VIADDLSIALARRLELHVDHESGCTKLRPATLFDALDVPKVHVDAKIELVCAGYEAGLAGNQSEITARE